LLVVLLGKRMYGSDRNRDLKLYFLDFFLNRNTYFHWEK